MNAYIESNSCNKAMNVFHEMIISASIQPNIKTFTTLMKLFEKIGQFDEVVKCFMLLEKTGMKPDLLAYNRLLAAYCRIGKANMCKSVIKIMIANNVTPNSYSFQALLKHYLFRGEIDLFNDIWNFMQDIIEPCDYLIELKKQSSKWLKKSAKTIKCRNFKEGNCVFGDACHFSHT